MGILTVSKIRHLMESAKHQRLLLLGSLAAVVAIFTASVLYLNGGIFTYTMDDPYIHLVLARSIAAGHYGYNLGEYSSPSSSIAFPFLLAPFVMVGAGTYGPLIINTIALLLTAHLLHKWLTDDLAADGLTASVLTLAIVFGFNLVFLVFTGMEHCLQVLLGLVVCRGMWRTGAGRQPAGMSFWLAVVAAPLIRYEMLAVSTVAVAFYAYCTRRYAAPALALAAVCLSVGGFSAFLVWRGMLWLPNSVLVKADYVDVDRHGLHALWLLVTNLVGNSDTHPGALLVATTAAAVAGAMRRPASLMFAVVAVLILLAELTVGEVGWYRRYEVWALTSIAFMGISAWAPLREVTKGLRFTSVAAIMLCFGLLTSPYLRLTVLAPRAANNIFNQQYQMGLLAERLGVKSIAANDIGLVGWLNPGTFVLDMMGLASTEILAHRRCCPDDVPWITAIANRHGVELAIVYDSWVKVRPEAWTPVAELRLFGKRYIPADTVVTIYGADSPTAHRFVPALQAFRSELPSHADLSLVLPAEPLAQ